MKIKDFFYSELDTFNKEDIPIDWWFERFRNWRTKELSQCDWTQLPDALVDKTTWAVYRQALRDLPEYNDFPNAELPIKPSN